MSASMPRRVGLGGGGAPVCEGVATAQAGETLTHDAEWSGTLGDKMLRS